MRDFILYSMIKDKNTNNQHSKQTYNIHTLGQYAHEPCVKITCQLHARHIGITTWLRNLKNVYHCLL